MFEEYSGFAFRNDEWKNPILGIQQTSTISTCSLIISEKQRADIYMDIFKELFA